MEYDYAEERRLFYVAMTRTKNRVYMVAPEQNPSEFLLELKHDYKNVVMRGNWNEEEPKQLGRKVCPICGYPLQLRYKKAYGLRLYMCTNEPEICSFMTNECKAKKMSIMKCDRCRDGYLIVKPVRDSYFLGCTNYKKNGSGCNRVIWMNQYYEMMKYPPEANEQPEHERAGQQRAEKRHGEQQPERPPVEIQRAEAQHLETQGRSTGSWVDNRLSQSDYVVMKKPALEPVMYNGKELNEVVFTILSAVQNVSVVRYYGVQVLLDVLRGEKTKKIEDAKLDEVPEYGSLKDTCREEIQAMVEWLIEEHFILKTKGQYPVLHPTYDGLHFGDVGTEKMLKTLSKYLKEEVIIWHR